MQTLIFKKNVQCYVWKWMIFFDIFINVENILKCDPNILKTLYNMSKLVFCMHMVFDIAYHKANFIIN
jgi:hypothetical protein